MSYKGINYDYDYRDTPFNNHDRTSWLRDNFLRPAYDAPLAQTKPLYCKTKIEDSDEFKDTASSGLKPDSLSKEASELLPSHEASCGKTWFGTISPSRMLPEASEDSSRKQCEWYQKVHGISVSVLKKPMAIPPPEISPVVKDLEGEIRRFVDGLHGKKKHIGMI